jgi:hypothetical protein
MQEYVGFEVLTAVVTWGMPCDLLEVKRWQFCLSPAYSAFWNPVATTANNTLKRSDLDLLKNQAPAMGRTVYGTGVMAQRKKLLSVKGWVANYICS